MYGLILLSIIFTPTRRFSLHSINAIDMLAGKYLILHQQLVTRIDSKNLCSDPLYTLAFGTDASFYRLTPQLVVKVKNEEEIIFLLSQTNQLEIPVTFRAAGTSLSGQAISDSVLVIAGEGWNDYKVLQNGQKIQLQPGLIGSKVNNILAPYKRKIGPDPASLNSAMIGGIAANNASGMCCGTADNSYQTVDGMRIIFCDGTLLDTKDETSREAFKQTHPDLMKEIEQLSFEVKANKPLAERIKHKFRIKNTMGYCLHALVDYSDPFEIIEHLMIGSEGTLGFIAGIIYKTVEELPYKASSMIIFPDIEKACMAVALLKAENVSTAELIDRAGLRSVSGEPGIPEWINSLSDTATALLVETRAESKFLLDEQIKQIIESIRSIPVEIPVKFTDIPAEYALYWKIRKGLFPSVGAVRQAGTTVIIEDVAFPLARLAEATLDLQALFRKYNYNEAVIFGHALDGNLHFVFTQDFSISEEVKRYGNFMEEVVWLVIQKYDGSLKAEHGTGRNMAPFVEFEWGAEAYDLMKRIKHAFDPQNLLNPGVILNVDPHAHLKNLKPLPSANPLIDKCIECGFCEPSCVSAGLTLTPRQRIAVFREISRLKSTGETPHLAASLVSNYSYAGNETCATDGLCAISCPVKIDTGKLIKDLRLHEITRRQEQTANWIASHFAFVTSVIRFSLSVVAFFQRLLGDKIMLALSGSLRKLSGNRIPQWTSPMPRGAKKIYPGEQLSSQPRKVVYFPSCINRSMGISKGYDSKQQLTDEMQELIVKAGYDIIFPENMNDLCCGMAFSSKGYKEAGLKKSNELEEALWKASKQGTYPILCDMSPCLFTMKENMKSKFKLYEPIEFVLEFLVSHLKITPIDETITVFPVCSLKKMGLEDRLPELAKMCATKVVVPETNCCGFAGDKGFFNPELNSHGLQDLKKQLPDDVKAGYSTSRTCEIGLSRNSGITYQSIVYLVNKVSSPK